MRLVPIECVREGCYLGRTLFDDNGVALLREGVKLTSSIIEKIKDIHIYSLYIVDEYSDREIEDIIKPELRSKSIKLIKDTFNNIERICNDIDASSLSKDKLNKIIKQKENYFNSIQFLAEELLENILSNKNIMINLVDIKSMDNYTYQHSVNVAVLSLVIGIGLQLPKRDLLELCIGALIHDIGKIFIPKEIVIKPSALTYEEYTIVKDHPLRGYKHLSNIQSISSNSKMVVLQHHERVDGLGYPEGKISSNINYLARIVAIADVYDALTSDRPYRRALSPNDAFEYILANADTMFDYDIVKAFSTIAVPYPNGTLVKLSTGDIAVVENTPAEFPLRPAVKVIKSNDSSKIGLTIDLVKELSIVIQGIQYEI